MSEDFSDDFIIEEEEQGANRTFLIIAGSLVALFIAIIACVVLFALLNRENPNDAQIAAIETQNAETAAQNARVTETIIAMELTANAPTATLPPTSTPEPTDTPTSTPEPTETSVVQTPGAEEETPTGSETPGVSEDGGTTTVTPNAAGTQIFGGDGGTFGTVTPISGTGAGGTGTGTGSETLPQTGASTVGLVGIGLLLVAAVFIFRRLRTG